MKKILKIFFVTAIIAMFMLAGCDSFSKTGETIKGNRPTITTNTCTKDSDCISNPQFYSPKEVRTCSSDKSSHSVTQLLETKCVIEKNSRKSTGRCQDKIRTTLNPARDKKDCDIANDINCVQSGDNAYCTCNQNKYPKCKDHTTLIQCAGGVAREIVCPEGQMCSTEKKDCVIDPYYKPECYTTDSPNPKCSEDNTKAMNCIPTSYGSVWGKYTTTDCSASGQMCSNGICITREEETKNSENTNTAECETNTLSCSSNLIEKNCEAGKWKEYPCPEGSSCVEGNGCQAIRENPLAPGGEIVVK